MEFVKTWEEIEKNLMTLEGYRNSGHKAEVDFYLQRIEKGICFVAYERNGKLIFGPSRFVGYLNNNMTTHSANADKDGRETNPRINEIIGNPPEEDEELEEEYKTYCESLGITPKNTGPFGVKRKYWYRKG
ncbi:MAG: hypothetical protein H6633_19230 [Anaerolineales bacterium]|nr:hypothetical protein [Anaerolineales bacterium]